MLETDRRFAVDVLFTSVLGLAGSSFSTFVELFHRGGLNLMVSSPPSFRALGDSGVIILWECLCFGRSGVVASVSRKANMDCRFRVVGKGSDAGGFASSTCLMGVALPLTLPPSFFASLRKGEIEFDSDSRELLIRRERVSDR